VNGAGRISRVPRLEETKRMARVLEMVQMIAGAPRRYHRRSLAERFEVCERMIQKDFDVIRRRWDAEQASLADDIIVFIRSGWGCWPGCHRSR
jgi:hypothetical protein